MRRMVAGLVLGLAACGGDNAPTKVTLNEDKCVRCSKPLTHLQHAGILKTADGKYEKFDDLHCLMTRAAEIPRPPEIWVNDYWSKKWIDARTAHYVIDLNQQTLTGRLVAFATQEEARSLAARNNEQFQDWNKICGK